MKIYYYIVVSLIALSNCLFSQATDSLVVINTRYDSILHDDSKSIDFLFYKHQNDVLINNLGVYNSAFYLPIASGIYTNNLFKRDRNLFFVDFLAIKPFTNISYVNASRKEQFFSVSHNQYFGKAVAFGFYLNKTSSLGDFVNQGVNTSEFLSNLKFENKKQSYFVNFNFEYYRLKQEENGGLVDILEFEDNLVVNPLSATINLQNSNMQTTDYSYNLNQRLAILKFKDRSAYFGLGTTYSTKQRMFYDNNPLSNFYNDVFIDTLATVDSLHSSSFENKLSVGLKNKNELIAFYATHSWDNYFQAFGLDTSFTNTFLGGVYEKKTSKLDVHLNTKYGVRGYRQNDFYSDFNLTYHLSKLTKVNFFSSYALLEPELKHVNYASNHFKWTNYNFKKQAIATVGGKLFFEKHKIELNADFKILNNPIYYNTFSVVAQNENTFSIGTFKVAKKYKLSKFNFKTVLIYQTTSNDFLFPLPDFIGRQLVYFETFAFKKVLKVQLGANLSYNSSYYGYAYMPSLTEFHIQNTTKIGNYPFVDVFVNFHLKRAQIFLKYEHFNSGWSGYEFYGTANYPALTRSLKFGVSWNLVD